ncbi:MAG: transglutaminase domain-containing protein [Actinobacteria bacterium]|nr:transglutaminase domain-containing protein [Actinomycetota bacterium]
MAPAVDREPRWGDAAALILLSAGGLVAWWGDLGSGLLWLAPVIAVAALTAGGLLGPRPAIVLAVAWVPGAILAAGQPLGRLAPAALDTTTASLRIGLEALPSVGDATPVVQGWALAAVLLLAGTSIGLAGILWRRPGWERTVAGFALLLVPLAGAVALQQAPDAAWEGAIVLVAVVLRVARGRLVPIVATATTVGAVALFGAQVAAPRAGWQPFGHEHLPQFHELDTSQTYGPLGDRRTGAVMLDINAARPALWRMQVLEAFDNRRWLVSREGAELPEPDARRHTIRVQVRGLHNQLVVSPGRIMAVQSRAGTVPQPGEGESLLKPPHEGETYRVEAATVQASVARLARVPRPTGRRYEALTQIGLGPPPPSSIPYPLAKLATDMPTVLRGTDWGHLFHLSWRLSAGVPTELGVVRRVEDYLLRGGRYRYTTEVGTPGPEPLLEFLFHTHAGYCQHFAGAAALILRIAGVPSRVAVGFATGEQIGHDTWAVRDEDAHAWVEVYFPGVGWVPFNPTPSAAAADISPGIDVLQAGVAPPTEGAGTLPQLLGAAAALALLLFAGTRLARRHRVPRTRLGELLVRLAPEPSGPGTTLRGLHPTLTEIGPATADLALLAERARFAAPTPTEPPHPNLMVWRALIADVGFPRALALMARTVAGRR